MDLWYVNVWDYLKASTRSPHIFHSIYFSLCENNQLQTNLMFEYFLEMYFSKKNFSDTVLGYSRQCHKNSDVLQVSSQTLTWFHYISFGFPF